MYPIYYILKINCNWKFGTNRCSRGMAYASVSKEALGVRVTEGEGNLPKVVLTSAGGRCVFFYYPISTFIY